MEPTMSTVACPHCGEQVRAAARICKGCRNALAPEPMLSSPATIAAPPAVLGDFRDFVLARGILTFPQLWPACADATGISEVLQRCVKSGLLAPAQVETISAAFQSSQHERLNAMLHAAVARSLITPAHAEAAFASFSEVAHGTTPLEHLVGSGLLTAAQAMQVTPHAAVQAPAPIGSFLSDRAIRRPLLLGPVAVVVIVPLMAMRISARNDGDYLFLFAIGIVPVILSALGVRKPAPTSLRVLWGAGTLGSLVFVLFATALLEIGRLAQPPSIPSIEPSCTMDGTGRGQCVFANTRGRGARACGQIVASCTPRGGTPNSRSSGTICSGLVTPGSDVTRYFVVASFDQVTRRAVPYGGDWRDHCQFDWEPR